MLKKISWGMLAIFLGSIAFYIIRYSTFVVPQTGMIPGIFPQEVFLVDKYAYSKPEDLSYGDIVIHRHKTQKYVFVWRLIGKPGDIVTLENGIPTVNSKKAGSQKVECNLPEKYTGYQCYQESFKRKNYQIVFAPTPEETSKRIALDFNKLTVPKNKFFFLGDCRNCAADSRVYGLVGFEQIIGKGLFFIKSSVHQFGDKL